MTDAETITDLRARLASAERLAASYAQTAIETAIAADEREVEISDALAGLRAEMADGWISAPTSLGQAGVSIAEAKHLELLDATIARLGLGAEGK